MVKPKAKKSVSKVKAKPTSHKPAASKSPAPKSPAHKPIHKKTRPTRGHASGAKHPASGGQAAPSTGQAGRELNGEVVRALEAATGNGQPTLGSMKTQTG